MSVKTHTQTETDDEYTPQYGDQFCDRMTGTKLSIQDVRDEKVTFNTGRTEPVDDLREAVQDIHFRWEVISVGDDCFEGDGYGDY